jgi:hypothetical protein
MSAGPQNVRRIERSNVSGRALESAVEAVRIMLACLVALVPEQAGPVVVVHLLRPQSAHR